jgi:hypothetical protein
MSLDVYLTLPGSEDEAELTERIFIRRGGATVEIARVEWDDLYPGREPAVATVELGSGAVYEANITHNMGRMAGECGQLYEALWRPEEIEATRAADLIAPLCDGLAILNSDHKRLQEFNPANGWGNYDLLVEFTANYLAACERWPEAEVRVSR